MFWLMAWLNQMCHWLTYMRAQPVIKADIEALKHYSKGIVLLGGTAHREDCIKHKQPPWSLADLHKWWLHQGGSVFELLRFLLLLPLLLCFLEGKAAFKFSISSAVPLIDIRLGSIKLTPQVAHDRSVICTTRWDLCQQSVASAKGCLCSIAHVALLRVCWEDCCVRLFHTAPGQSLKPNNSKLSTNAPCLLWCDTTLCVTTLSATTCSLEYENLLLPAWWLGHWTHAHTH